MNHKSEENRMAMAQPCVAGKQPVGVLSTTQEKGFAGFAGFVKKKNR